MTLGYPLEEAKKAADLGIQESHLVGMVQPNHRMGHLAFFRWENQVQSKSYHSKGVYAFLKYL